MLYNSRFLSVVACKKFVRSNLPRHIAKPLVSLTLMIFLFAGSIPPAIASSLARETITRSSEATNRAWITLASWFKSRSSAQGHGQNQGMPPTPAKPPTIRPREPYTKAEREAKVARMELNVAAT